MQDLIVLCADLDMRLGIAALLRRSKHLGFRPIAFEVYTHDMRDHGVFQKAHDFLRPQCHRFSHAVAMCDFEGCGKERKLSREEIEGSIEQRLWSNGWEDRAIAIVIKPELEAWIWVDWRSVAEHAGWQGDAASMRNWLTTQGLIQAHQAKPDRPKESFERVLKQTNKRRSGSLFSKMGGDADTTHCTDPGFGKLVSQLQGWFPPR